MAELRLTLRRLIRSPRATITAILALAIGIGLATTLFSVLRGVMLRGLPVEGAERVMAVGQQERAFERGGMGTTAADFAVWHEAQQSFEALGAYQAVNTYVTGEQGGTATWVGAYATPETFELLRVRPRIGRLFSADDTKRDAPPVVLIGHRLWQQQLGSDADVLGKSLTVNRREATVIGVMPEQFGFPYRQQIWMPFRVYPETPNMTVFAIGRLARGVGREAAQQELQALSNNFRTEGPWVDDTSDRPPTALVEPYLRAITDPVAQRTLVALFLAACAVLAVACANVTNLLLARGLERRGDLAVRRALGARRAQLIAPLLTESLVLATLGGALGLCLAQAGIELFRNTLETSYLKAFWVDVRIDLPTVGFVGAAVLIVALLAGWLPALRSTRLRVSRNPSADRAQLGWLGRALVVAQVTVSAALLVMVGLMARSLADLSRPAAKLGSEQVLTARLSPWQGGYETPEDFRRFFREVETRTKSLPGVEAVALASTLPMGRSNVDTLALESSQAGETITARRITVTSEYFRVFGVQPLSGRTFLDSDTAESPPVALVNQSFVARHADSANPLGQRLRVGDSAWVEIVGVVPDITAGPFDSVDPSAIYLPSSQQALQFARLAVRSRGDALALAPVLRREITAIDRFATLYELATMDDVLARETWSHRLLGSLAGLMGASTLLLAAVGLYAVLAFNVRRRVHEMGVRRALGARGEDLARLVLGSGLRQVGLGLLLGLLVATGLGRILRSLLEGVTSWDPLSFGAAAVILVVAAFLAMWGPARWVTRVDPMVAMRQE